MEYKFTRERQRLHFFGDYPRYLGRAILLQQAQGIFAELSPIAIPEGSNKTKADVDGIPPTCYVQNLAGTLYNREDRESELFRVASQYAANGDRTKALQIASRIEDAGLRANISMLLAVKPSSMNRFDEALQIMENQPSNQDVFLLAVIHQLVSTSHFNRAIEVINKVKDSSYKREALEFVALKLVEAKDYDLAQHLLTWQ